MNLTSANPDATVATSNTFDSVLISDIVDESRIRSDYGDIAGLVSSIREFGIIQPIVLQRGQRPLLVAGGRRLESLRRIGQNCLSHGREFVWRDEDLSVPEGRIRLQAMELEENLRRKDLEWSEVLLGKKRLLELMQSLHGVAAAGRPTNADKRAGTEGFGVVKLAAMLNQEKGSLSRDLQLADLVAKVPALAKLPNKSDAFRKLGVATKLAGMQSSIAAKQKESNDNNLPPTPNFKVYHGDFRSSISNVGDCSVDLVLTDLPYGAGVGNSTASHGAGLGSFTDSFSDPDLALLLTDTAREAYRVLTPDRFAVFFFGVAYYKELYDVLTVAGFTVDPYWFIWLRDRTAPPSPSRYAKRYDPALICSKGNPTLLRPNLGNLVDIPSVRGAERLHGAQKPVALMEHFILDMTIPDATILDFCAGSGTTGVAALKNKRKAILFELEEPNCVLIESRLKSL